MCFNWNSIAVLVLCYVAPAQASLKAPSESLSSSQRSSPVPDPLPLTEVNSTPPNAGSQAPLNQSSELSTVPLDSPVATSAGRYVVQVSVSPWL